MVDPIPEELLKIFVDAYFAGNYQCMAVQDDSSATKLNYEWDRWCSSVDQVSYGP